MDFNLVVYVWYVEVRMRMGEKVVLKGDVMLVEQYFQFRMNFVQGFKIFVKVRNFFFWILFYLVIFLKIKEKINFVIIIKMKFSKFISQSIFSNFFVLK